MTFDVGPNREKYVLKAAGNLLRNFRTKMRKRIRNKQGYIRDKPPRKYQSVVPDIVWRDFVAHHLTKDFQVV